MRFEMLDVGPPLSQGQIAALEAELRVALPEDYRAFLARYNGGRPEPSFFPIHGFGASAFGEIQRFFSVGGPAEVPDLAWYYRTLWGRIAVDLFPIAGDGSGNIICISLAGVNRGAVHFWDHDNEYSPPGYDNVHFVAESFTKFLDSIYFEDLSEEIAKSLGKPIQRPN
jgi:hypothetical protein